ncbi:MAG: gliding motility-associated C-terminal domain-containing protein, partial [Flavobacteriales bacterium]
SPSARGWGRGGGGGGGVCWINDNTIPLGLNVLYAGGFGGLAGGAQYGAQAGCNGGILTGLSIPQNTTYPAVHADFTMSPTSFTVGNTEYSENTSITFTNESTGQTSSNWNFGDEYYSNQENPQHEYAAAGDYAITLIASNELCADTAVKDIYSDFDMPNVFTPNTDGVNDLFPGIDLKQMQSLEVMNRWGETVFISSEMVRNWDGNINGLPVKTGVYYFIISYRDNEGKIITKKGSVTLLR